jgi:hypothetical protein
MFMARKRKRSKRNQLKIVIPPKTMNSVGAVILMMIGVLIMVSFSGQGALLQKVNTFLTQKFGVAMLFVPFVFISSGLAMLRAKWAWSKPHVLLGTLLMMFSTLGVGKTGEIGGALFANFAVLLTPVGTFISFLTAGIVGFLVMTQWSLVEFIKFLSKKKTDKEAEKEAGDLFADKKGFNLPQLRRRDLRLMMVVKKMKNQLKKKL